MSVCVRVCFHFSLDLRVASSTHFIAKFSADICTNYVRFALRQEKVFFYRVYSCVCRPRASDLGSSLCCGAMKCPLVMLLELLQ